MDADRRKAAVWVGALGGVATILGPAFPWLIDTSQQPNVKIDGFTVVPFALFFGVAIAVSSVYLLTDTDPRKVVAWLGASSLAVLAMSVPVVINKEAAVFGVGQPSETTKFGIGLWVTLIGAILGVVATGVASKALMSPTPDASAPGAFDLGEVSEPLD